MKTTNNQPQPDESKPLAALSGSVSWSTTPPTGPGYFWSRSHGGTPVIAWLTATGVRMSCDQTVIVLDSDEGRDWMATQAVEFWPEPILFAGKPNDKTPEPFAGASCSACIVVWADEMGLCIPMGWDDDCAGAICGFNKHVAVFSNRVEARRAIDISTKFAALCKAQGRPANEDFLGECRRNVRVLPLRPNEKLTA